MVKAAVANILEIAALGTFVAMIAFVARAVGG